MEKRSSRKRQAADSAEERPTDRDSESRTIGELRRRLAEMGDPWTVDPRLNDEDPIPQYGRGGELLDEIPGARKVDGEVTEEIRDSPPDNLRLRQRWQEADLLPPEPRPKRPSTPKPPKRSPVDQG